MSKLLECTRGAWHQDLRTKGVISIRADHYGYITDVETDHFRDDRKGKQLANAALIAAAYDHALVWWASYLSPQFAVVRVDGDDGTFWDISEFVRGCWHDLETRLPSDPFGFPILTDDLRARLIAEMEGATEPVA